MSVWHWSQSSCLALPGEGGSLSELLGVPAQPSPPPHTGPGPSPAGCVWQWWPLNPSLGSHVHVVHVRAPGEKPQFCHSLLCDPDTWTSRGLGFLVHKHGANSIILQHSLLWELNTTEQWAWHVVFRYPVSISCFFSNGFYTHTHSQTYTHTCTHIHTYNGVHTPII